MELFTLDVIFGLVAVASMPAIIIKLDKMGLLGQPDLSGYVDSENEL